MAEPIRWFLCIESAENWRVDRRAMFATLGVSARYERRLRRDLHPGDRLVTYITKACAFADVREVTDGLSRSRGDAGYTEGYAFKIRTRAVIANEQAAWVDIRPMLEAIDLTRGRGSNWRHVVRQTFRPLAACDGSLILAALEVATAESIVTRRAA